LQPINGISSQTNTNKKAVMWMQKQLEKKFRQAKGIPITFVSAKTGIRVDKIMDEVLRVYEKWNTRVSTAVLNKWITALKKVHKMPGLDNKFLRIRYVMQIKTRPPTFFIFVNDTRLVPEVYERYLRNMLVKEFGFEGVPVRLLFRDNRHMFNKNFENIPQSQRTIMKRIELSKSRNSITFRRRRGGSQYLYGKYSKMFKKA
jgi:predicted GTPase